MPWRGCLPQPAPDSLSPCCARCVSAHPPHVPLPHIPRVRDFRLSDPKLSHCTAAGHFSGKQQFRLSGPRFSLLGAAKLRGQLGRTKPASELLKEIPECCLQLERGGDTAASPLKAHRPRAIWGQQRAGFVTCKAQPSFLQARVDNDSSGLA